MTNRKPTLRFGPTGRKQGFTATSMSSVHDLKATRFVRELLQNSLDAAVEAGREVAHVIFRVTSLQGKLIPDLNGYRAVFNAALQTHAAQTSNSELIRRMTDALQAADQNNLFCLSVIDNGIGLDAKRMKAILGDGAPEKSNDALGSFGVGHFAPIATSDLRYVLYGGLHTDGHRIASGTAVIASHQTHDLNGRTTSRTPNEHREGSGQLSTGNDRDDDGLYKALSGASIPKIIKRELDDISHRWQHGTAVVIPAFNYFNEKRTEANLHELVPKVAAYNFHPAITEGRLLIEIDETEVLEGDDTTPIIVNATSVQKVLAEDKDQVRSSRADSFHAGLRPSGRNAYSASRALSDGTRLMIKTSGGNKVDARILTDPPCHAFRVDLYRDGMWITDKLRGLSASDFADCKPFHAVILLRQAEAPELAHLVHTAEGPDHNEINFARLSRQREAPRLRAILTELANAIREQAPKHTTEEYTPNDFLVLSAGNRSGAAGSQEYSFWGAPMAVTKASPPIFATGRGGATPPHTEPDHPPQPPVKPTDWTPPRISKATPKQIPIRATVVQESPNRHLASFETTEDCNELEMTLTIDENTDVTCRHVWSDEGVTLKNVDIKTTTSAKTAPPTAIVAPDGASAKLSGILPGVRYICTLTTDLPSNTLPSVYRVQLSRPTPNDRETPK